MNCKQQKICTDNIPDNLFMVHCKYIQTRPLSLEKAPSAMKSDLYGRVVSVWKWFFIQGQTVLKTCYLILEACSYFRVYLYVCMCMYKLQERFCDKKVLSALLLPLCNIIHVCRNNSYKIHWNCKSHDWQIICSVYWFQMFVRDQ